MKSTRRIVGENDRAIADLTGAIASGSSIALLGAGASVVAGYPTWSELLLEMESRAAESDRLGPKYVQKLKNLPDPLWRADEYRQRMGESAAAPPLTGTVEFHLHETFDESVRSRTARAGRATTSVDAYGAFTVGAVADGGATRLELDLSRLASAPKEFREA